MLRLVWDEERKKMKRLKGRKGKVDEKKVEREKNPLKEI